MASLRLTPNRMRTEGSGRAPRTVQKRNRSYPPVAVRTYAMPISEVLRLAATFQPEELCS